jgi:nitrile hydratase subunit beta
VKLQHHLGGLEGLDDVPITLEERVFVEPWETRIFGIHVALMGLSDHLDAAVPGYVMDEVPTAFTDTWTWADLRAGAEAMNPFAYFQFRYYEKWLGGISSWLVAKGYVDEEELVARAEEYRAEPERSLPAGGEEGIDHQVLRYLREGDSPRRGPCTDARFAPGDRVTVTDVPPDDHTRLPGFLRGRTGTVERRFEGRYGYFCPTGDDGLGEPMPVYAVRFEPVDLWGPRAEPGSSVYGELYEVYLQPATPEATA